MTPSPSERPRYPAMTATAAIVDARTVEGEVKITHPRAGERTYPARLTSALPLIEPPYRWQVSGVPRRLRYKALDAFGDAVQDVVGQARREGYHP